jgi:hypothetical protein
VVINSAFNSKPLKNIVCDFHQYLFINTSVTFMFATPYIVKKKKRKRKKKKGKALPVTGREGP